MLPVEHQPVMIIRSNHDSVHCLMSHLLASKSVFVTKRAKTASVVVDCEVRCSLAYMYDCTLQRESHDLHSLEHRKEM